MTDTVDFSSYTIWTWCLTSIQGLHLFHYLLLRTEELRRT